MTKKISQSEFEDMMENHLEWGYNKSKGKRASFYGCDLSGRIFNNRILYEVDFSNSILKNCTFENSNLTRSFFSFSILTSSVFKNCLLLETDFLKAEMQNSFLLRCECIGSNFSNANLINATLEHSNFSRCNFISSSLLNSSLKGSKIGSPGMFLLANWENLSEELTALAMAYDASCHHDKKLFEDWAKNGDCPYELASYERACFFNEKRSLWDSDLKPPGALELLIRIIKEKCADSDWHNKK